MIKFVEKHKKVEDVIEVTPSIFIEDDGGALIILTNKAGVKQTIGWLDYSGILNLKYISTGEAQEFGIQLDDINHIKIG